jgi:protein involved in sex pheromone biosynthesis
MRKTLTLLTTIVFLWLAGCSDYISSKRDGLKPYDDDVTEKQAQESKENESE